jgi:TonB family protein
MMNLLRAAVPLAILLAVARPAAAQERLIPGPMPAGCVQATNDVPGIDLLADTDGLLDALRAAGLEGPAPWTAVSVSWTETGEVDSIFTVASGLAAERAAAVQQALTERLLPQMGALRTRKGENGEDVEYSDAWGVLIRVDGGAKPRVRVAWPEECPATVANRDHVLRKVQWEIERFSALGFRALPRSATVLVRVLPSGEVAATVLLHSSGVPEVDAAALRTATEARYRPGTRDGRAVETWVELPVVFTRQPPPERGN